jgi:hypothetical protein
MAEYNLQGVPAIDAVERAKQNRAQAEAKKKQEEEKKKRQAAEQQKKAAADKAAKEKKLEESYVNPLQFLQKPISQFLSNPSDVVLPGSLVGKLLTNPDDVVVGTLRGPEAEKAYQKSKQNLIPKPVQRVAREAGGVVGQAAADLVEGPVDVLAQTALDLTVNLGKKPNEDGYKRALSDIGVEGPETGVGKAASKILSMIVAIRAGRKLPGGRLGTKPIDPKLTGISKRAAQAKKLATEDLIPGAVADFFLTNAKDGNLSETIQNMVPEDWRDSWAFGLATDKYGSPMLNRVKSLFEGAPLNYVGNGVAALVAGRFAAQAAKKAGKSNEEAVAEGVEAAAKKSDELETESTKAQNQESNAWNNVREEELNKALEDERIIREKIEATDPEDTDILEGLNKELEQVLDKQKDLDNTILESADPNAKYDYWETQGTVKTDNINKVAADQVQLEDGFPNVGKIGIHGASGKTLTDSAVRSIGIKDTGAEDILRKYEKDVDVQQIARDSGKTVDQVLSNAARIYRDFMDSLSPYDDLIAQEGDDVLVRRLFSEKGEILVSSTTGKATPSSETLIAMKAVVADLSNQIYDLAKVAEDYDASQVYGFNAFDRAVDRLVGVLEFYKEGTQFFGGSLNSLKQSITKNVEAGEAAMAARDFEMDDVVTPRRLKKWAQEVKDAYRKGDAEAVDKMRALVRAMVLAGGDPSKTITFSKTAMQMFGKSQMSVFYNSILSGVKTLFRNFSGIYRLLEAPTSMAIAGAWKGDKATINAALAGFHAITTSTNEALRVAVTTFKTGIPASSTTYRVVQDAESLAMLEAMDKVAKTDAEKTTVSMLKAHYRFAEFLDFPSKLLVSMDDAFKTILARQRIAEMAAYKASKEGPLDVAKRTKAYIDEYAKYIDPNTGQIKDKGLQKYAEIGTFQNDPGAGLNHLSAALDNLPYIGPAGRLAVPFIRTPANIFSYQLEHLPFTARFSKQYQDAMASGDPLLIAEYEGRQAVGAIVAASIVPLAWNDMVTGNIPIDPKERQRWKNLGIQPRSFKVAGQQISYNALEPLSNIIAAVADIVAVSKVGGAELGERLMGQLILAFTASFTEKAYFSGLTAFGEVLNPENWTSDMVMRGVLSTANNQIVLAGLRRAMANTMDPYMREYSNEFERQLLTALPGYSLTRPEVPSVLTGKPLLKPTGGLWNANVPFEISPENKDPVARFLMDVEFSWKDSLETAPNGRPLTAEEKRFIRKEMYRNGLRRELDNLRKLDWVKTDLKKWKEDRSGAMSEFVRDAPRVYDEVSLIWQDSRKRAFDKLELENTVVADQNRKIRAAQYQAEQGNYNLDQPKDFGTADVEGMNKVYQEIINFK